MILHDVKNTKLGVDALYSAYFQARGLVMEGIKRAVLDAIVRDLYDQRIMGNLARPHYVERLIHHILGPPWELVSHDWAGWDLENPQLVRVEVKQSAARQTWTDLPSSGGRPTRGMFDIAPRKGYYTRGSGAWVDAPGRNADIYLFAWHPVHDPAVADHRIPDQWEVYVVPEHRLPTKRSISQSELTRDHIPVSMSELPSALSSCIAALPSLKVATQRPADAER